MIHYITPSGIASAWVANEIGIVERHGVPVVLHSLRPSEQKFFSSAWAKKLDARTRVIYPIPPFAGAMSVLAAPFLFGGRFFGALGNAVFGKRESLRNRVAAFGHFLAACHWARSLRGTDISHLHSQWIHSGGTVGMYGAWLLGIPFSFTGHAADLFRDRVALEDKVRRADFIVCISEFHKDLFRKLGAREEQMHVVYCGIDLAHFTPVDRLRDPSAPAHVISSGRLVGKKGFKVLVEACALLASRGVDFRCTIGGNGPQEKELRELIAARGLEKRVSVTGKPLTQEELPSFMREGDLYALPCIWADDGDVDGLPQMLMEAMACGVPAISTRLVGIPDLITDGESGLLVEPNSVEQLAGAIERMIKDPALARRLAAGGARAVREKFEINEALQPLVNLFKQRQAVAEGKQGGPRRAAVAQGEGQA